MLTSPSLFEERRLVIIDGIEAAGDGLVSDLSAYLDDPAPDVVLVLRHRGGVQNKRLVDRVKKLGFPILACDPLKSTNDRIRLVEDEARREGGRVSHAAAGALVSAIGSDLHEALGTIRQLVSDYAGTVDEEAVRSYFAGRIDTSGFEVADAVAAGEGPRALVLARRAFASKIDPIVVVAALARKLRDLAKVSVPGIAARDLGMAPWQVDKVRAQMRIWDAESLGKAICLVARADADVKGGSRDAAGAVERCIIEISRVRAAGRR